MSLTSPHFTTTHPSKNSSLLIVEITVMVKPFLSYCFLTLLVPLPVIVFRPLLYGKVVYYSNAVRNCSTTYVA
jgi:hypothetical protein